ncbi:hypothetical protein GS893_23830 [Rhodococcus hoagii]|nr:hypothetical protein [Prescottella equi]
MRCPSRSVAEGRADPGLTELGRRQARRLASALTDVTVARVVTSSQLRAIETAGPARRSLGVSPVIDERLAGVRRRSAVLTSRSTRRASGCRRRSNGSGPGCCPTSSTRTAFRRRVREAVDAIVAQSTMRTPSWSSRTAG